MLEIKDMTFSYGRRRQPLFSDFSFSLGDGKICGLLGRNGAGKSTLLYMMCGLLHPSAGTVRLGDADISRRRPSALSEVLIVPEELPMPPVSLRRYAALNSGFYPRFSHDTLQRCISDFDLDAGARLDELSMGQRRKAFMSFALAANTSLLLLDEPTNGFDIPSKSQMRKAIAASMGDEKTVLISTHQVADVTLLLDHVVIIDGGRLLLDETCSRLSERLLFAERPASEPIDGAIYSQPSPMGNSVVAANLSGEESDVNLETLFNAILANPEGVGAALATSNNEPFNTEKK